VKENEPVTVTSALPYVHGVPHLGNFAGSVFPAEIYHRYLDLRGTENIFVCGGDVHGTPLELEALERDESPEDIKNEQVEKVREAYESLDVDFTLFSDTHSDFNRRQTCDMFEELYCSGLIDERTQEMAYCQDDERFLPDRYVEGECPHCGGLARGDQCDDCGKLVEPEELENLECQVCGSNNVEFRETDHLFLDLTEYKDEIRNWIETQSPLGDSIENQVLHDLEEAESRSITRDQDWGFDVPVERVNERIRRKDLDIPELDADKYDDKVLYVWFDAPIGYIGFTRELFDDSEEWRGYWDEDSTTVYSIGKDNAIFHAVIWPTMLLGASNREMEYGLPDYEFVQQFMNWEGGHFSKSRDRGVFVDEAVDMYPADYWRFYIARKLPTEQDTDFSWSEFESETNSVLNDTVGNFVNRTLKLIDRYSDGKIPEDRLRAVDDRKLEEAEELVRNYRDAFEDKNLKEALEASLELARLGDAYLSEQEPWNNEEARGPTLQVCSRIVRGVAVTMYPFIPGSAEEMAEQLGFELHDEEGYDEVMEPLAGGIMSGSEIGDPEPIFEKVDVSDRDEDNRQPDETEEEDNAHENTVSIDDFDAMDLRVGEVEEVEEHPNADRLYVIQVDVGDRTLQTCAGLRNHYEPEELEGRKVTVLANLESSELRGETSECMMLAADDEEGNVSLLQPNQNISEGSEVA
jgi:methionyl-tRNA synthetase